MISPPHVGLLFLAIALIFLGAAFHNYQTTERKHSATRQTWLRIAIVFAIVGIGLQLLHLLLGR